MKVFETSQHQFPGEQGHWLTLASSSPVPEPSPAIITILLTELQALKSFSPADYPPCPTAG